MEAIKVSSMGTHLRVGDVDKRHCYSGFVAEILLMAYMGQTSRIKMSSQYLLTDIAALSGLNKHT